MAPLVIHSTIPRREDCPQGPILVILLGRIFSSKEAQEEATRVTDARSRFALTGSGHLWPTYVAMHDVEEDIYGNTGTASDLHDIATTAKANGWQSLVFFDELSWRQHNGTITNHEDPTLSATVVNIECVPSDAIIAPESTFFVRRLPIVTALAESYLADPQQPRDWSKVGRHAQNRAFQLHLREGFYLYNPHEPIFGDGSLTSTLSSPDHETPLKELIDTATSHEQYDCDISLLIQPLIHLEDEEITAVHTKIQTGWEPEKFHMGRWKQNAPASRRDVARILRHFCEKPDGIIFLLSKPVPGKPLDTAVYERPCFDVESYKYGIFIRQSPEVLRTWWLKNPLADHGFMSQLDGSLEFHVNPLLTFPLSLPFWYKTLPLVEISRERDRGYSNPHGMLHEEYLVFYLTKSLNEEEEQIVKDIMARDDAADTGFTYIPWKGETDGGPEDMLRLMKIVRYAARTGFTTDNDWAVVFVDAEFKNDKKVAIGTWRLDDDGYSGIQYGRTDYEVASCLVNVPGNMDIEDFVEDLKFYQDPDYSGILPEEGNEPDDGEDSETQ